VERDLKNPKVKSLESLALGAPDTVRCARLGCSSVSFCSFLLNPNLNFLLVCVEPLAPVEHIIYNKLVSPNVCVGHSTTKIIFRKRLNPISLSVTSVAIHQEGLVHIRQD
jgi:hypothetical protein